MNLVTIPMLCLAWVLDSGLQKFRQLLKEPLVKGILVFCAVLLLGLLWGEYPDNMKLRWRKYFFLLTFIPLLSLLNKERLLIAIAALLIGYCGVILIGAYQWIILGEQGVSLFKMSYLSFSAMLGIGAVLAVYLAITHDSKKIKPLLWIIAFLLLFIQFNQSARALLLATISAIALIIFLLFWTEIKKLVMILAVLLIVVSVLSFNSSVFQERFTQIKHDITLLKQGNYSSSLGYRIAVWDVGIDGIAKKPFFGHGTGAPESYFVNTIVTYKGGIYQDLPKFHKTSHYHNDWIEIGMHTGMPGMLALVFLFWGWYQSFKKHRLAVLGAALVGYILLAGLTDTFMLYSRIPVLLLVITAIAINQQVIKLESPK